MSDITHLLWLDLETTGTDEKVDNIIEIGVILTDVALSDEVFEFDAIVRPDNTSIQRMLHNSVVREMHANNGLLWNVLDGKSDSLCYVENEILDRLYGYKFEKHSVMLAGSGVGHFDRRFLREYMMKLHNYLAYSVLDVGVIRRAYQLWGLTLPESPIDTQAKTHRALEDARLHLAEARSYRDSWLDWQ